VVSDKNDKTIVVRVETLVKHPLLKKYVRRRKKFTAHDPMNECGMGDKVKIVKMNVDEAPDTAAGYGIRSIPTMFLFKDGKQIDTKIGLNPQSAIVSWIEANS